MGHEQRMNDAILNAEYERLVGPTRPFQSRAESGCQKCGSKEFAVRWCPGKNALSTRSDQCSIEGEHLHVLCMTCRYGWNELTREQSEAKPALVTPA